MKSSDEMQLELIRESIFKPEAELEAKKLLLDQIYREVVPAYRPRALNGGGLASLPGCVSRDVCEDDLGFTYNALRVLMARYMVRDARGRFMETPSMVMARVAMGFAPRLGEAYRELYRMLVEGRFVFNSPTLFNMFADGARGTLSACYVTPVYDSMDAIMDAAVVQAMTFKWGGGQGFSFSELRPRWDYVRGTSGRSSGPMSFMRLYD
ncbi:MAG: ribonucleoside-diphosphate reductase, adenosylcobalamin-dependent, partial [Desulfurococcales archaeon]|nr:ribonucleoside-diphosphate reductase, adenosylcobalamin-dependent [Desulfurococcales archaeon]